MRAQLRNGAEADRPLRQLRLDRSVHIKRIGHAVDDAGLENSGRAPSIAAHLGGRPRASAAATGPLTCLFRLAAATLGPGRVERLRLRIARVGAEQEIER